MLRAVQSGNGDMMDEESQRWYQYSSDGYTTSAEEEETIYEFRDESGERYYFNTATGVSDWNPPEWFDIIDPVHTRSFYTVSYPFSYHSLLPSFPAAAAPMITPINQSINQSLLATNTTPKINPVRLLFLLLLQPCAMRIKC